MKSKEEFLKIVEAGDVDEVWVNFSNPFTEDHEKRGDKFYVYKAVKELGDIGLAKCELRLEAFFAPKLDSDEEDDVLSVELVSRSLIDKKDWVYEEFKQEEDSLTLIYKKGVGIIG